MPETPQSGEQMHPVLFTQLVLTFSTAALQQMGKVMNPITKVVERNLDQASFSIDMLDMIQVRMAGNLSDDEAEFLRRTISELKMNFMDELAKDEATKKEAAEKEKEEEKEPEAAEAKAPETKPSEPPKKRPPKKQAKKKTTKAKSKTAAKSTKSKKTKR